MQNNSDVTRQALAFADALRTQRHAHVPVIRFAHWPQFIATVRAELAQSGREL
ncbi:hypothetical protein ACWXWB_02135 [Pantoea dispersa]|uniref:hypothetical protein n=1 Tax=Pantoea dispersa TaxID=59814 RepID=UPI002DBD76EF|nr:hypothetical protein [Pantoea dispersa]MEB5971593.1 hypothetical protein [Pantoea dispersa]